MKLYVIYDHQGGGRLIGVFDCQERAWEIINIDPHYYKLYECELNSVTREAVQWAKSEENRRRLQKE